jgi:hypothetical protein
MPTLILFAVCEKVILEAAGNASIINLVHGMEAASAQQGPIIAPILRNAVSPVTWSIFAVWRAAPGDTDKQFVEKVEILWPDRTVFYAVDFPLKFEANKTIHQSTANVIGFPIGQVGDVTVNMWIECDRRRIGEVSSWTVSVTHRPRPN